MAKYGQGMDREKRKEEEGREEGGGKDEGRGEGSKRDVRDGLDDASSTQGGSSLVNE